MLPLVLLVVASVCPAQSAPAPAQVVIDEDRLDALCQPLVDAEIAVGFVVGVVDRGAQLVRGYGRLSAERPGPPDGDTVYEIGSISKVFTGLLLALAVGRGEVTLEDPVARHLPKTVAMPAFAEREVQLWHLATHCSGLPRMPPDFAPGSPTNPYADYGADQLHASLAAIELRRGPGDRYEYSNLAAGLLGHTLVRAAGAASFDELLRQRVCEPLGLPATAVVLDAAARARLAPPHDGDGTPNSVWDFAALAGAGGIRSTVHDQLRFAQAQLAGADSPLAAAIARSQEPRSKAAGGPAVALGWHIARDGVTLWHNGQTGGYHGYLAVQPEHGKAVCVLSNSATGQIDALGERIVQALHGVAVTPIDVERPVAVARDVLAGYVGEYRLAPAMKFTVALRPAGLFAQLTGQPSLRLYPRTETEFFYRAVAATVRFERDGDGRATKLVLHQNGRVMECPRIE